MSTKLKLGLGILVLALGGYFYFGDAGLFKGGTMSLAPKLQITLDYQTPRVPTGPARAVAKIEFRRTVMAPYTLKKLILNVGGSIGSAEFSNPKLTNLANSLIASGTLSGNTITFAGLNTRLGSSSKKDFFLIALDLNTSAAGKNIQVQLTDTNNVTLSVPAIKKEIIRGTSPVSEIVLEDRMPTVSDPVASPENPTTQTDITFSVTATDPEGAALTYTWDFGDGTPVATTAAATHKYAAAGTYAVSVRVHDGTTTPVTKNISVTVTAPLNTPPVITTPAAATPTSAKVGDNIVFSVAASDSDSADTISYFWDFGDSSAVSGSSTLRYTTHTYTAAGTYTAKVTVSDGKDSVTSEVSVTVISAPTLSLNPSSPSGNLAVPYANYVSVGEWTLTTYDNPLTLTKVCLDLKANADDTIAFDQIQAVKVIVLNGASFEEDFLIGSVDSSATDGICGFYNANRGTPAGVTISANSTRVVKLYAYFRTTIPVGTKLTPIIGFEGISPANLQANQLTISSVTPPPPPPPPPPPGGAYNGGETSFGLLKHNLFGLTNSKDQRIAAFHLGTSTAVNLNTLRFALQATGDVQLNSFRLYGTSSPQVDPAWPYFWPLDLTSFVTIADLAGNDMKLNSYTVDTATRNGYGSATIAWNTPGILAAGGTSTFWLYANVSNYSSGESVQAKLGNINGTELYPGASWVFTY